MDLMVTVLGDSMFKRYAVRIKDNPELFNAIKNQVLLEYAPRLNELIDLLPAEIKDRGNLVEVDLIEGIFICDTDGEKGKDSG